MYFLFSTILILTLNAQNLHPSWPTARHLRTTRSGNSSDQNSSSESWMDGLTDYEKMVYKNFALSSKIYPDKLNLLLKEGLHSNQRRPRLKIVTSIMVTDVGYDRFFDISFTNIHYFYITIGHQHEKDVTNIEIQSPTSQNRHQL